MQNEYTYNDIKQQVNQGNPAPDYRNPQMPTTPGFVQPQMPQAPMPQAPLTQEMRQQIIQPMPLIQMPQTPAPQPRPQVQLPQAKQTWPPQQAEIKLGTEIKNVNTTKPATNGDNNKAPMTEEELLAKLAGEDFGESLVIGDHAIKLTEVFVTYSFDQATLNYSFVCVDGPSKGVASSHMLYSKAYGSDKVSPTKLNEIKRTMQVLTGERPVQWKDVVRLGKTCPGKIALLKVSANTYNKDGKPEYSIIRLL